MLDSIFWCLTPNFSCLRSRSAATEVTRACRHRKTRVRSHFYSRADRAESSSTCLVRSDAHEDASVKTGARRLRDFPDIHSASSAKAERHERVCGRSHSIPASHCATSDLGMRPGARYRSRPGQPPLAGPECPGPECQWKSAMMSKNDKQQIGTILWMEQRRASRECKWRQ